MERCAARGMEGAPTARERGRELNSSMRIIFLRAEYINTLQKEWEVVESSSLEVFKKYGNVALRNMVGGQSS